jgi:3-phytase
MASLPTGSISPRFLGASLPAALILLLAEGNAKSCANERPLAETGFRYVPSAGDRVLAQVTAIAETDAVPSRGDAADDPAIWVHPTDSALSTVIGTDKRGGLAVYELSGRQIQYVAGGRIVNVDTRPGFPLDGTPIDLVTAGDRSNQTLAVHAVDPLTRELRDVAARPLRVGIRVYGSCMYRSSLDRRFYAFIGSKSGEVEQWLLFDDSKGRVDARLTRSFDVGTDVEGCVADDELGHLYIGEENVGIWKYSAEPGGGIERRLVDGVGGGRLTADVEGLTLYYGPRGRGYLLASSQGSSDYAVYRREGNNDYLVSFEIVTGNGIDGVTNADGIDVVSESLGPKFPCGLFVTQDDRNDRGNQNFKLVSWQDVERSLHVPSREP